MRLEREEALGLIGSGELSTFVKRIKDPAAYILLAEDEIFQSILERYFFTEVEKNELTLSNEDLILSQLHIYHCSEKHPFTFPDSLLDRIAETILKQTGDVKIAELYPHLDISKKLIAAKQIERKELIKQSQSKAALAKTHTIREVEGAVDRLEAILGVRTHDEGFVGTYHSLGRWTVGLEGMLLGREG